MTIKFIRLLALIAISALVILSIAFALNQLAANNATESSFLNSSPTPIPPGFPNITNNPTNTPTLSPTAPTPSQTSSPPVTTPIPNAIPTQIPTTQPTPPITTPTPNAVPTQVPTTQPTPTTPLTVTFDFETATPQLVPSMGTPLSQTKDGITALFSSSSDPAGFSVQSYSTTFYKLSQFQGNYLSDSKPTRDTLEIRFSQPIKSVTFTFATFEYDGGPTSQPSYMLLTAYMDSTANQIGSTTARGTWPSGGDAYPQGTLTYDSTNSPFNLIRIELPYQGPKSSVDYLIDTLIVKTS